MLRCVSGRVVPDILKDSGAYILRVKQPNNNPNPLQSWEPLI